MATVYGSVKQNHGFLTVFSEPGQGTVINIFLPREMNTEEVVPESATMTPLRGTETILFVEDEEMLLNLETAMLEESVYKVLRQPRQLLPNRSPSNTSARFICKFPI